MTDLDDRLRADGAAWQQLVDAGARGITPAQEPRERSRWLAPALSAAAVLAVAVALAVVFSGGPNRRTPSGGQHWRTHTFGALTLSYPTGWHPLNSRFLSQGPTFPLGYLVSDRGIVHCPSLPAAPCDNPVPRLTGTASLVIATDSNTGERFRPNTTVDGRPAILRHDTGCVPGARYGASITFRGGEGSIQVQGCTASTDPAARRAIDRILTTLRYSDGPTVTISGQLREVGGPYPGIDEPLPGTVTVRRAGGGLTLVRRIGDDGRYSVDVPPGRYTVVGRSPRIQGGKADCPARPDPVVARGTAVRADAICEIN